MTMSKELNELTEQRYGLSNNGHEYYKFIDAVLVAVINELKSNTVKFKRFNLMSCAQRDFMDRKPTNFTNNKNDLSVKIPTIKNTRNFGNCINCTDCSEDRPSIFSDDYVERTEQDELKDVADKIKAGHDYGEDHFQ